MLQELDPLEIYGGAVFGPRRTPGPDEPEDSDRHPRQILEELLVGALSSQPCYLMFSGGRDSSVVLAAAVDAARRHGLPEPVPLTARFPTHPATHETEWQEQVIRHLGVTEWIRVNVTDELDTLGPLARETIGEFGVYWPSSAHNMRFFARQAAGGGTLITGGGGDELFAPWNLRRLPIRLLARLRPRRRAAKWILVHQLPAPLRRRIIAGRNQFSLAAPWLREDALHELQRRIDEFYCPLATPMEARSMQLSSRYTELVRSALDTFAQVEGVRLVEPLYDPSLVKAVVRTGPPEGYQSRGHALEALFADLLPREVLYRSTKAHFSEASWGPDARAFASSWDGTGIDDRIVDPVGLRAEWAKPFPNARSLGCLHQAWYATQASH